MKLRSSPAAFTLIEVMVSTVIVVILAGILISATDITAKSFARTSAKIEQFSEARRGFETVTRRLAEATLNTYFDYYDAEGNTRPSLTSAGAASKAELQKLREFLPVTYGRQSELRFTSGRMGRIDPSSTADRPTHGVFFQAPVGEVENREQIGMLDQTLNTWGYFVEIDEDEEFIPRVLTTLTTPRRRSRLLEYREPSEANAIYFPPYTGDPSLQAISTRNWWFIEGIDKTQDRQVRVVAENIVALIVLPRLSRVDEVSRLKTTGLAKDDDKSVLCPDYFYDSALTSNHNPPIASAGLRPEEVNPKNQLPPVVQVVMIALDENSAARLDAQTQGQAGFGLNLDSLLLRSVLLEDRPNTTDVGDGELRDIETLLINARLSYRIFNSTVLIRGAKWSRAQAR